MSTNSNIKGAFDSLLAAASSADLSDNSPEDNNNTSVASAKKKRSQGFPQKLYNILKNEDASIISWTANGDAFIINDNDRFSADILPRYFRHTKVRVCITFLPSMVRYGCIILRPITHNLTST